MANLAKYVVKLEAQTANFWRFHHDHFRKGRPDLLVEIKRSNSNSNSASAAEKAKPKPKSSGKSEDVADLKNELNTLKDRIAKMTNNIDHLTELVHTVTLKDEKEDSGTLDVIDGRATVGAKRKKTNLPMEFDLSKMVVDEVISEMTFTPESMFPPEPVLSQEGQAAEMESDEEFVDELFNAFGNDMGIVPHMVSSTDMHTPMSVSPANTPVKEENPQHDNAPDSEMMNKLSDALTVLPKDIQEMLVNKLISTITSSDSLKAHLDSVCGMSAEKKEAVENKKKQFTPIEHNPDIGLPLAAATLTALLVQFSAAMKDQKNCVNTKSLPVIPCHA